MIPWNSHEASCSGSRARTKWGASMSFWNKLWAVFDHFSILQHFLFLSNTTKKYVTKLYSWFISTTTSIDAMFGVYCDIGQFSTIYLWFRPFFHSIKFLFRASFVPLWSKMIPWNCHGASCSGSRARAKFWRVYYEIGQFSTIYPRFRPFFRSIKFPFR